ncbi:MAG: hypothetical protein PHV28_17575 [Kiritimatiellae bacterium]|nr:hypothetical protein [Kiritimatiellia bacterium]
MTALKKTSGLHPDGTVEENRANILAPNPAILKVSNNTSAIFWKTARKPSSCGETNTI